MTDYRVLVKYGAGDKHTMTWIVRALSAARAVQIVRRAMQIYNPPGKKTSFRKAVEQGMRVARVSELND